MTPTIANLVRIVTGFQFTEGPLWHPGGYLLFSDTPANKIYRLSPDERVITWLTTSGWDGRDAQDLSDQCGSNGLACHEDQVYICQHGNHGIARWSGGELVPIAQEYNGRRFNSPNDLVLAKDGTIYFTDPPYGLRGQVLMPNRFQPHSGIYRLRGEKIDLVGAEFKFPNGLALSADQRSLYVGSNDDGDDGLRIYDLDQQGMPTSSRVIFDVHADGFLLDRDHRFWMATNEGVLVMSASGERLGLIALPEIPTNLCFNENADRLFITARSSVYSLDVA